MKTRQWGVEEDDKQSTISVRDEYKHLSEVEVFFFYVEVFFFLYLLVSD